MTESSESPAAQTGPRLGRFAGLRVRFERRGEPRVTGDLPILVLHGWGAHLEAIEPIVGALATETEVIALDLPGFGQSEPPPAAWDADDYARFVIEFLDALEVDRCHLVGHSNGGRIAICLAGSQAARVGRLLLCDSAGLRPRRRAGYYWRVALAKLGRVFGRLGGRPGERLQRRMRERLASADYLEASPQMRDTFRRLIASDLEPRLGGIETETLIVWGEHDEDTPLWMAKRLEQAIAGAGLVVFEGAGHYSYAEDPVRFGRIARLFLCDQPRQVAA
ncbi:MAG: alpha/beta fold hydrolase [Thermoleophilaceae bacterium]|nr:alpha/beta fold hydrolase [Thermoleophilaceae bacterium]